MPAWFTGVGSGFPASVCDEQPVSGDFRTVVLSGCDKRPVSRGFRRPTCCTSGGRVHVSCRHIKACRFCPRTLSREKNPPNRRDLPSLERGAEEENLAYSSVAERAIGARTSPGDPVGGQASPRSLHSLRPVQVLDLEALANPALRPSAGDPYVRVRSRETI